MSKRQDLEAKIASVQRDIEDNERLAARRAARYLEPLKERNDALDTQLAGLNVQLEALGDEGEGEDKPATGRRRRTAK